MFSGMYSTKEKPLIKVLPIKRNQKYRKNNFHFNFKTITIVQTKVRTKYSPDHVIRAHREHVCAQRWTHQ